ncbi:MAG: hypothetical protein GC162_17080 [Planctomycetes bacterium]|nr:hypothetical protein [Planctomycetota bacterium]
MSQVVLLAAALLLLVGANAHAAVIANYDFNAGNGVSTDTNADSNALNFTGVGGNAAISGSTFSAFLRSNATGSTQNAALSDTDYFSFTVNAVGAAKMNLTSLVFKFGASTGTPTLHNTVYVQNSVQGFGIAAPFSSYSSTHSNTGGLVQVATIVPPIDLSAAIFKQLTTIEFRFFFSDDQDTTGEINRLDDVVLNGVIVPSPMALPAGLGLLGIVLMGRRRR